MWRPSPLLLAVTFGLALAVAFSCKTFDLPAETCDPSTLDAKGALQSDGDCSRCLEDHCCDAVGVCERKDNCATMVRATQQCVLDHGLQGAQFEKECAAEAVSLEPDKKTLKHQEADGAYRCMRGSCGVQCGLPVCKVDQAARLIRNAECDKCFAGACCLQLNRCYESRACKLTLECIISVCGETLGASLNGGMGEVDSGLGAIDPEVVCKDPTSFSGSKCVFACLCKYRENDQGLPSADPSLQPFNLAREVYACGSAARCGDDCARPADSADAQ